MRGQPNLYLKEPQETINFYFADVIFAETLKLFTRFLLSKILSNWLDWFQ
jgi:hypothetical protein